MGKMAEQLSNFANSIRTFYKMDEAERWVAEAYAPAEVHDEVVVPEAAAVASTQPLPLAKAA
jgi:hypothetical protein